MIDAKIETFDIVKRDTVFPEWLVRMMFIMPDGVPKFAAVALPRPWADAFTKGTLRGVIFEIRAMADTLEKVLDDYGDTNEVS